MAEKLYAGSTGRDQQEILRYRTKYAFLRIIYSLSIFSLGCIKTPQGNAPNLVLFLSAFIIDEIMKDILFFDM